MILLRRPLLYSRLELRLKDRVRVGGRWVAARAYLVSIVIDEMRFVSCI